MHFLSRITLSFMTLHSLNLQIPKQKTYKYQNGLSHCEEFFIKCLNLLVKKKYSFLSKNSSPHLNDQVALKKLLTSSCSQSTINFQITFCIKNKKKSGVRKLRIQSFIADIVNTSLLIDSFTLVSPPPRHLCDRSCPPPQASLVLLHLNNFTIEIWLK